MPTGELFEKPLVVRGEGLTCSLSFLIGHVTCFSSTDSRHFFAAETEPLSLPYLPVTAGQDKIDAPLAHFGSSYSRTRQLIRLDVFTLSGAALKACFFFHSEAFIVFYIIS